MAKTINVNIRVDEEVKKQEETLFAEITTKPNDFYNPVNQKRLYESIERLEKGFGSEHELIDVEE